MSTHIVSAGAGWDLLEPSWDIAAGKIRRDYANRSLRGRYGLGTDRPTIPSITR
jgi:hypothetical protein